jgi:hypothetical protein
LKEAATQAGFGRKYEGVFLSLQMDEIFFGRFLGTGVGLFLYCLQVEKECLLCVLPIENYTLAVGITLDLAKLTTPPEAGILAQLRGNPASILQ